MDRYGAYNEKEWRYGRREYDEYEEEAWHYQGRTRQESCQLCGEHGHIAPSCRLNRRRYQEVCNTCGNYGHSSYTCSWSNKYYEKSAYDEYNKQEVYQQEKWSDHYTKSQDLYWEDNSCVSPQVLNKLEEFLEWVEEFTKDGDDSFARFSKNYFQSMQRFMARQQLPQPLEDKWQKTIAFVNEKIKKSEKRLVDNFPEEKGLAESMQLHPKDDAATEVATKEELDATTEAATEEEEVQQQGQERQEEEEQQHEETQQEEEEQQPPTSIATKEQVIIINILKPLPYLLPTNQIYVYILGDIKAQGKWLRKTLIPWFHVLREGRIKVEAVHDKGAHGDGVPFNIKVYPP